MQGYFIDAQPADAVAGAIEGLRLGLDEPFARRLDFRAGAMPLYFAPAALRCEYFAVRQVWESRAKRRFLARNGFTLLQGSR